MLTYRDWNDYADLLADALAGRGLGADDVVAVRCSNRIEWAVIALACSKINARLLTLDPELTPRAMRERLIAGQAGAIIVGDVAPVRLAPALEGLPFRLRATMDGAFPASSISGTCSPVAQPRFGPVQPSLLAWTAGASGRALPVGLPHRRAAPASASPTPVPQNGASLITVPLHRVWSPVQFWAALVAGRAIHLVRSFRPAATLDLIRKHRITHWSALPASFEQLRELGTETVRAADTSSLQELEIGGAPATSMLKAWLADLFAPILNEAYGSTEAGRISFMPLARLQEKPESCGRPVRGVTVEIRDERGQRLPSGVIGEIWARTPRSLECDLPASSLRTRRDEDGYVATGDAGRVDDDGFIYITGKAATLHERDMRHAG